MVLTSSAFKHEENIPREFTCDGADISPSLQWTRVPEKTKSLAIICDDPDAPGGTWVHWVYYDIPFGLSGLPENIKAIQIPETGGKQGLNDFGNIGYGGPCPPSNIHRYFFKLYTLDTVLNLKPGLSKSQLLKAMQGHILINATLIGKYSRK